MCRAPHLTHPPTQRAVRLPEGTRLEGPGRTWKDRTRQEERRPSTPWLVGRAPNFGTFLPTRGLRRWPSSFWAGSGWLPVWRLSLGLGLGLSAQGDSTVGHVAGMREHT